MNLGMIAQLLQHWQSAPGYMLFGLCIHMAETRFVGMQKQAMCPPCMQVVLAVCLILAIVVIVLLCTRSSR